MFGEELMAEKIMINLDRRLKKIIPGFLENRRQELETLDEACKKKKFKAIEDIGHQLMGSAGSYGFLTLSRLGKDLESAGKEKNLDKSQFIISEITEHLENLEIDFD